jgi:hypothetical protein
MKETRAIVCVDTHSGFENTDDLENSQWVVGDIHCFLGEDIDGFVLADRRFAAIRG